MLFFPFVFSLSLFLSLSLSFSLSIQRKREGGNKTTQSVGGLVDNPWFAGLLVCWLAGWLAGWLNGAAPELRTLYLAWMVPDEADLGQTRM